MGAGNVATHLARSLKAAGHRILCIYSRSIASARLLASGVDAMGTDRKEKVPHEADFYLLAVPDRAISSLADSWKQYKGIWLHTSGSVPLKVFADLPFPSGVLYPLQTFSRQRMIPMEKVPFLVEGSDQDTLSKVRLLARSLSPYVEEAGSEERLFVHLAAVFANNFANHMVHIAQELMRNRNLDPELLDPLLKETMKKILDMGAASAQTGPAARGDASTIRRHLELLKNYPGWKNLYTFVSQDIQAHKGDDQF